MPFRYWLHSLCRSIALRRTKERFANYRRVAEAEKSRLQHDKDLLQKRLELALEQVDLLEEVVDRDRNRIKAESAKYTEERKSAGDGR